MLIGLALDLACRRPGADRLRPRAPAGGVLLGEPAVQPVMAALFAWAAAVRSAGAAADRSAASWCSSASTSRAAARPRPRCSRLRRRDLSRSRRSRRPSRRRRAGCPRARLASCAATTSTMPMPQLKTRASRPRRRRPRAAATGTARGAARRALRITRARRPAAGCAARCPVRPPPVMCARPFTGTLSSSFEHRLDVDARRRRSEPSKRRAWRRARGSCGSANSRWSAAPLEARPSTRRRRGSSGRR